MRISNMNDVKKILLSGEKVDLECKEAKNGIPKSIYESYSGFANTNGGYIILGVREDKTQKRIEERFIIEGVDNPRKLVEDFWNTINGNKVNTNILLDEDVYVVTDKMFHLIVIHVPRAAYNNRPVFVGENPYKGTFKRNNEGDYHATEDEVKAMIRDQNPEGNDGIVLEHYSIEDIDLDTLRQYRLHFQNSNPDHIWNSVDDKSFLENIGGYKRDRRRNVEGITMAGLLMFGKGLAIRDEFDNIFMDYRDESSSTTDIRWNDRVTYDGTWENNLFNFFLKVTPKLTNDLKKPFLLEGVQRIGETAIHKAVREAFVNAIIHADYLIDSGTLKIIKRMNGFEFTNPGTLKLPIDEIFNGGNSKARNPRMQTMLRLVGFGDNIGSGFPAILDAWGKEGWIKPELIEDTKLNKVTLRLKTIPIIHIELEWVSKKLMDTTKLSTDSIYVIVKLVADYYKRNQVSKERLLAYARRLATSLSESAEKSANSDLKSAEKSADSCSKSAERKNQILLLMDEGAEYSTKEISELIGLKGPRTRQLLNELVEDGAVISTAGTKNRRYIKTVK